MKREDETSIREGVGTPNRPEPAAPDRPRELTARALAVGGALGVVGCASNLYVGLRNMVAVPVGVTACLISYSFNALMLRISPRLYKAPMSALETNVAQTVASSAGYATGGAIVSAAAGYLLVVGRQPPFWVTLGWTFVLSSLGLFFAASLKRSMVDREGLPFPSGIAVAETVRSLYAGGGEARGAARALGIAGVVSAALAAWRDGLGAIRGFSYGLPTALRIPGTLRGVPLGDLSLSVEMNLLTAGVGALIGLRVTCWLLVGSLCLWVLLAPRLVQLGAVSELSYSAIQGWALWPGASLLASASLVVLVLQSPAALRAFQPTRVRSISGDLNAPQFLPRRWLAAGILLLSLAAIGLGWLCFGIPPAYTAAGIALSWMLTAVACRSTGETDVTPTGALGLVTHLAYGGLMPGNVPANLVGASVTGNSAASAADLLTSLKAGKLLGASPVRQFAAQLFGCALGSISIVAFFYLLAPTASALETPRLPAPGALTALSVARLCASGLSAVSPPMREGLALGALGGLALGALEALLPERARRWAPSPIGLGLSLLLPASMCISLFLGGLASFAFHRLLPAAAARYAVPISSGLIAGESLVGVALAALSAIAVWN